METRLVSPLPMGPPDLSPPAGSPLEWGHIASSGCGRYKYKYKYKYKCVCVCVAHLSQSSLECCYSWYVAALQWERSHVVDDERRCGPPR